MKIGILGTGMVGNGHGSKLIQLGHEVRMGSRTVSNAKAIEWARASGSNASYGTFADAAAFGEIIYNCTLGMASLEAIKMAGEENLNGKILVDISNPLNFGEGMPPTLGICNTDSLGEQIQRAYPNVRVVKALNTTNYMFQTNPALLPGEHDIFMCGNDNAAKSMVMEILTQWYGWKRVIDLGDIGGARAMEMMLPMWLRLWGVYQSLDFNFKIVKKT